MFKKTPPPQMDLFRGLTAQLSTRKSSLLEDPLSWHNVFFHEITQRVDESVFAPLFCEGGRPNAPLRVLLAMMILKEGNGWSDEQLFDNCRFNLRCMLALGLCHIDDDIPAESTYYEFRRRLSAHSTHHGEDLVGEAFRCAVQGQISTHNIKGEKIRMDSKLIQSNIASAGRLELVLETVRVSIPDLDLSRLSDKLEQQDLALLESLRSKTASNLVYPLDNGQKKGMLERLGHIIKELLPHCSKDGLLVRLYREQYREVPGDDGQGPQGPGSGTVPRDTAAIPGDSLQSPHDPEATYRRKGRQRISGYHANLTETCNGENPFNLITDVRTETADICEDAFLAPAIQGSDRVLGVADTVRHVTTDGGYDSRANREMMAAEGSPHWNMARHKGTQLRYQLAHQRDGSLMAYCKKTGEHCRTSYSEAVAKHVIHHGNGRKRYMTKGEVTDYIRLQAHLASQGPDDMNIRPNVESTVHQTFHRLLKRDKVKYRGKYRCNMYVLSRAYWTNFRRIFKNGMERTLYLLFYFYQAWKSHKERPRTVFCL